MQDRLDLDLSCEAGEVGDSSSRPYVRQSQVFREPGSESLLCADFASLLPEDDASVWIRAGLAKIDLSSVLSLYKEFGGVAYEPRAMLGILLLAYFEGEAGSRTVERKCRRDIGYMHVGYGQKPDDRTIRRFRRRIGPALEEVFQQVVLQCKEEGLLPFRRVAIDGTKIASAASQLGIWLKAAEKEDVRSMGFEPPECSDPDARNLGASGKFVLGYNCQAAVDCDTGIVVAVEVCNVSSDAHLLAPMTKKVVENAGETPCEVAADAGYDTNEGSSTLAEMGITAFVSPQTPVSGFWTVTGDDEILCPMGQPAVPDKPQLAHGKPVLALRVKTCSKCPFFKECCGKSGNRSLGFPVGSDPIHRLNTAYRARSPEGKQARIERMTAIEPVFADIKWNKGLKRFLLKGEEGARIEWTLKHLARNLAKLQRALQALLEKAFLFQTDIFRTRAIHNAILNR